MFQFISVVSFHGLPYTLKLEYSIGLTMRVLQIALIHSPLGRIVWLPRFLQFTLTVLFGFGCCLLAEFMNELTMIEYETGIELSSLLSTAV